MDPFALYTAPIGAPLIPEPPAPTRPPPIALATPIATAADVAANPAATAGDRIDIFAGAPPLQAAIQRAVSTVYSSGSAVQGFGLQLPPGAKNDDRSAARLRSALDQLLQPWVDLGQIRVDSYEITAGPSAGNRAAGLVHYTDLTTGSTATAST